MHTMIYVNLPVADVARSRAFFTDLGYTFNEVFSDDKTISLVLGENMIAMLLQRDYFDTFHPASTADATTTKECIVCLDAESRDGVDALVDRAVAAGATAGDTENHGFMYGRSYSDLDGHSWQIMWMDPAAAAGAEPVQGAAEG